MDEILTLEEVAEFLSVSKVTLYKYANNRKLPFFRFGNNYRIRKSDLIASLEKRNDTGKKGVKPL